MTQINRRKFSRIVMSAPAEVRQDNHKWHCGLIDISLKGVLMSVPDDFSPDTSRSVLMVIALPGMSNSILMEGEVRHQEDAQVGIAISMMDIDSASSLRRLVELNVGDDSLLKRELHALVFPDKNQDQSQE